MRWAVLAGVLAFAAVPASALASNPDRQAVVYQERQRETSWLAGFPTPAHAIRNVRGANHLDTLARQRATMRILLDALYHLAGGGRMLDIRQMPADVAAKRRDYEAMYIALQDEAEASFRGIGDRRRFFSSGYEFNRAFVRDTASRLIPAGQQNRYLAAAGFGRSDSPVPGTEIPSAMPQAASGGSSWIWIGLLLLLAFWIMNRARAPAKPPKKTKTQLNNEAALLAFGATAEERQKNIDAAFDQRDKSIAFDLDWEHVGQRVKGTIMRSLSAMSPRERETLRSVYHLYNLGMNASEGNTHIARFGIVFGDGKGTLWGNLEKKNLSTQAAPGIEGAIKWAQAVNLESSINLAINDLNAAVRQHPDHPLLKSLSARLYGDGGDMVPDAPLKPAVRGEVPPHGLILGLDEKDPTKQWFFDGEGSLLTVAPPGSGKTQCHVFPNLLQWPGPAVVLDVKGEIYAQTSKWRAENVGPVFRFNPLDPAHSHCYNPLSAVRADLEYLWEDSRFLADMMIVPTGKAKDPFWESRARDVVTAAIARACIGGNAPAMADVLDILHGVGWDKFVGYMQARTDFRSMSRAGHSLGEMDPKTRDGVLQQALSSTSAWDGERISRATSKSDWNPLDLRSGNKPTVYICLRPNEVDSYVSVLRVLIAQHIRILTTELPPREAQPILFLLDELPRLRQMPPVEEALEIGRQYGIKLWMFTQSLGQLKTVYPNADGMVGSCAVRMFMNPSLHDETAKKISDDIGLRESIVDGTRVKIVEPNVLAGPDFQDMIIVMAPPAKAARLRKNFAHADEDLAARMGSR